MLFITSTVYGCVLGSARVVLVSSSSCTDSFSLSSPCLPLALGFLVMFFENEKCINKSGMQSGKHFFPNSHDLVVCLFPWE